MGTTVSSNGRGSDSWHRSWTHLRLDRPSAAECRVTLDHPPRNTVTATTVSELGEIVGLVEHDADLNVVVFDSGHPDVFLADYDTADAPLRTAWADVLARLAGAPVFSIAMVRGRACGAGGELVLACDLRLASRERTVLGPFAAGAVRDLDIVLVSDARLEDEVGAIATRLAICDHAAIARTKASANRT